MGVKSHPCLSRHGRAVDKASLLVLEPVVGHDEVGSTTAQLPLSPLERAASYCGLFVAEASAVAFGPASRQDIIDSSMIHHATARGCHFVTSRPTFITFSRHEMQKSNVGKPTRSCEYCIVLSHPGRQTDGLFGRS